MTTINIKDFETKSGISDYEIIRAIMNGEIDAKDISNINHDVETDIAPLEYDLNIELIANKKLTRFTKITEAQVWARRTYPKSAHLLEWDYTFPDYKVSMEAVPSLHGIGSTPHKACHHLELMYGRTKKFLRKKKKLYGDKAMRRKVYISIEFGFLLELNSRIKFDLSTSDIPLALELDRDVYWEMFK